MVTASTSATISASYNGVTRTATLTVNPQPVLLFSLGVNPTTVTGGSNSTGTATLDGQAPAGGAQVTLSSNNPAATVPGSVTVPAGATSAPFTITTSAVAASTSATITASYNGVTRTSTLSVTPPVVSSLGVNPTTVTGGSNSTGTVTLNGPAPAGGAPVTLSSNNPAATVPGTVTVPAAATSPTFTLITSALAAATPGPISPPSAGA